MPRKSGAVTDAQKKALAIIMGQSAASSPRSTKVGSGLMSDMMPGETTAQDIGLGIEDFAPAAATAGATAAGPAIGKAAKKVGKTAAKVAGLGGKAAAAGGAAVEGISPEALKALAGAGGGVAGGAAGKVGFLGKLFSSPLAKGLGWTALLAAVAKIGYDQLVGNGNKRKLDAAELQMLLEQQSNAGADDASELIMAPDLLRQDRNQTSVGLRAQDARARDQQDLSQAMMEQLGPMAQSAARIPPSIEESWLKVMGRAKLMAGGGGLGGIGG